jgi:hypothetical protein
VERAGTTAKRALNRSLGITDQREYNQIGNFAIVEWGDNTAISAAPPSQYVPALEARFDS